MKREWNERFAGDAFSIRVTWLMIVINGNLTVHACQGKSLKPEISQKRIEV